ncbi:MAG: trigger factor [Bacteroidales bacterium]|nr:trigger factor [Bacteroidales bacterium]
MNTTQTSKGEQLISIQINVLKEDYEPLVKKELNKLKQKAQIPGFRPGMVPFGMIKKMYGAQATIEVLNDLVSKTLNNYILENKLDLVGYPLSDPDHQEPVDFETQEAVNFYFEAALRPEIKVDYKKIKIDFAHVIADDAAIDKTVEELIERNPNITHPETVGEEDIVELKVREAENGQELEGGFKKDYVLLDIKDIRTKTNKKKFIGKPVGSEFIVNLSVMLGSNEKAAKILGQDAPADSDYNVIIDDIRHEEKHELNEEFFKLIFSDKEIKDVDAFRAAVKEEMERQYANETDRILFTKMIDALVDSTPFVLPDAFLKRWIYENNQGKLSMEDIEKNYEANYNKGLRWQLIEDSIVKDNMELAITEEEVRGFLRSQIFPGLNYETMDDDMKGRIDKIVENYLKNEEQINNVKNQMADIKMTNFLKTKLTINYTDQTYDEFIKDLEKETKQEPKKATRKRKTANS